MKPRNNKIRSTLTSNLTIRFYCKLFCCLLFTGSIFGQNPRSKLDNIASNFNSISKDRTGTSIYLNTNKGIYETGEDLWFKATILDAQYLTPSSLDRTLYVQLINMEKDSVVWQEKYEITNGFSDGQVYLDGSLEEGDYLLEAFSRHSFTKRLKEYNSVRKIKVVGTINAYIETAQSNESIEEPVSEIQFNLFPEGGYLVDGIKGKVAFKAVDGTGNPVSVSGTLYENQKPLFKFKATHAGLGSFDLVPNSASTYHIKLDSGGFKDSIYSLPKIRKTGILLQLAERGAQKLVFKVSDNSPAGQRVYLRAQIRGRVQAMASGMVEDSLKITFPTEDFPQGICEVTVFDETLRPVAERLVYVNAVKKLYISTEFSKRVYETREKVTLRIKVADAQGNPVQSRLGLSIYDELYNNPRDGKNILTHYQLTTQLKGKIYYPGYYFDQENKNRVEALDLLLLTQGWRRYVWNEENMKMDKGKQVLENGISGRVSTVNKKKGIPEQQAVMVVDPAKNNIDQVVALDSVKHFYLEPAYLKLGRRFYIKHFEKDDGSKVTVNVSDGFDFLKNENKEYQTNYPITNPTDKKEKPISDFRIKGGINLDEVTISAKKATGFRDKYLWQLDSLAKLNINTDYVCKSNFLNCEVHRFADDNRKPVEGETYQQYVGFEWNGDHSAYTVKGRRSITYHYLKFTEKELLEKFNLTKVQGYYGRKEFYEPDYDTKDDGFPDYRNTLLWVPEITTDKNGETEVEFFCSDISSHFLGIIEGASGEGLLGRDEFRLYVKKD